MVKKKYSCNFFGDGATEEGFSESLDFSSLHNLPVFVCENNEYSVYSIEVKDNLRKENI